MSNETGLKRALEGARSAGAFDAEIPRQEMTTPMEHQIWTTDEDGHEILVATTRIASDAGVVFDAVRDARAFVEWRTAAHGQYRGRLFRGWDGDKKQMYGPAENANLA